MRRLVNLFGTRQPTIKYNLRIIVLALWAFLILGCQRPPPAATKTVVAAYPIPSSSPYAITESTPIEPSSTRELLVETTATPAPTISSPPPVTNTPTSTIPPPPTATTTPQEIITIMTYNVLNGGFGSIGNLSSEENRLSQITEVINAAQPDILGIQEAYRWHLDDEAIARELADVLGMEYYYLGSQESPEARYVALFSRYPIVNATYYANEASRVTDSGRASIHAELLTESGATLHVFVVHLNIRLPDWSEMDALIEEMAPYLDANTVLMGDMNFIENQPKADRLHAAGWIHPEVDPLLIDQVWASPNLAPYLRRAPRIPTELTAEASDHRPVLRQLWLFVPKPE